MCVARNALNFYFRLSQFSPANEKVFFICLAHRVLARSGPFINTGSNYARGTRAGCVSVCCYYVYVTYTQRGLHGVIDKVKFRTFAGNFCGLLHFGFDLPHIISPLPLSLSIRSFLFYVYAHQGVIWASNFKALAINYVRVCRRSPFRSDCLIYPLSLG